MKNFELDIWRTTTFAYGAAPSLMINVASPSGSIDYLFKGQKVYYPSSYGNYTITLTNTYSTPYSYEIRVCANFCPYSCMYTYGVGYCHGNGACIDNECECDYGPQNNTLTSYCDTVINILPLPALVNTFLGVWIFLIVLGILLVCVLPAVIICVCCFGCFGLCAAGAVAASSPNPQVIHHHHGNQPSTVYPAGVQVQTNTGMQYIQVPHQQQLTQVV